MLQSAATAMVAVAGLAIVADTVPKKLLATLLESWDSRQLGEINEIAHYQTMLVKESENIVVATSQSVPFFSPS